MRRLERAFGGAVLAMKSALRSEHSSSSPLKGLPARIEWDFLRRRAAKLESRLDLPFTRYVPRLRAMNPCTSDELISSMNLSSESFRDERAIPGRLAFCVPDPKTRARLVGQQNPQLAWSDLPSGTRSLMLVCHDYDVPSKPDDVNKEGRSIPHRLPARRLLSLGVVDLNPAGGPIREGEFSDGVTPRGKKGPEAPRGARQGLTIYTPAWFAATRDMAGDYFGYDGLAPRGTIRSCTTTSSRFTPSESRVPGAGPVPRAGRAERRFRDMLLGIAKTSGIYTLQSCPSRFD